MYSRLKSCSIFLLMGAVIAVIGCGGADKKIQCQIDNNCSLDTGGSCDVFA